MRDVLLAFRCEGLLIARAATEGDDDDLLGRRESHGTQGRESEQPAYRSRAADRAQKLAAVQRLLPCNLTKMLV